jgi:uncharacterized protein (DUF2342 family)
MSEKPEKKDDNPFGMLPELMRSMADAMSGKTEIDQNDPYGISAAFSELKKTYAGSVRTYSSEKIEKVNDAVNLANLHLDQCVSFPPTYKEAKVLVGIDGFVEIEPKLKALLEVAAEFAQKRFVTKSKVFMEAQADGQDQGEDGEKGFAGMIGGPLGMFGAGSGEFMDKFLGTMFQTTFSKSIKSACTRIIENAFSLSETGFGLNNEPGIIYENIESYAANKKTDINEYLVLVALLEEARTRLFRSNHWIYNWAVKYIKNSDVASTDEEAALVGELAQNITPEEMEDPASMVGKVEEISSALDANSHLDSLIHLYMLVESWAAYVSIRAIGSIIPSIPLVYKEVFERSNHPAHALLVTILQYNPNLKHIQKYINFWDSVYKELGPEKAEGKWGHPDFLPLKSEVSNPQEYLAKSSDDFDIGELFDKK